jgi:hypothetical protein
MAGAFTHFIICDEAKSRKRDVGVGLWQLLNKYYPFLFLGAASPDLPYLSFKTGKTNWADAMHYEKTNGMLQNGYARLKESWPIKTPADEAKFIWLMGFASHLVADATIHPVVQAIVGPYQSNPTEHRVCEMTQDSLIYNICRKTDIRYSEFSDMLRFCRESPHYQSLMDYWEELLEENYREKGEEPEPPLWFDTYSTAIGAAGESSLLAFFRHIGVAEKLIYKTRAEIEKDYPNDVAKYFKAVKFPGGGTGPFKEIVFEKALNNVTAAWKMLYGGLKTEIFVAQVIRNWNLDTGVDMNSGEVTFWAV